MLLIRTTIASLTITLLIAVTALAITTITALAITLIALTALVAIATLTVAAIATFAFTTITTLTVASVAALALWLALVGMLRGDDRRHAIGCWLSWVGERLGRKWLTILILITCFALIALIVQSALSTATTTTAPTTTAAAFARLHCQQFTGACAFGAGISTLAVAIIALVIIAIISLVGG